MKLKQSKVFKAGIGYTIGNVMVKGINFLFSLQLLVIKVKTFIT